MGAAVVLAASLVESGEPSGLPGGVLLVLLIAGLLLWVIHRWVVFRDNFGRNRAPEDEDEMP